MPKTAVRRKKTPSTDLLLGLRVRAIRRRKGMTLDQLSAATGLDKGYLSRLERSEKSASIGTLQSVAAALGETVGRLIGERPVADEIRIVRAGERKRLMAAKAAGAHIYEAITLGNSSGAPSVFVVQVGSHGERVTAHHAGEEMLFVLEGTVRVSFGEREAVLADGDSVCFPGYLPHSLQAEGRRKARVLIVVGAER